MKKKYIYLVVGILILSGGLFFSLRKNSDELKYRSLKVELGDLRVSVLATGTVSPQNRLEIKAPVPGRMEKVLVEEGNRVSKGQIIAWMSSSERAAMLDAARAQGEDEYKKWSELYLATPILAPISGMIILRSVEPGQTFTSADAIFTMSDRLTVKAQVDETDMAKVKIKQVAEIALDAYPNHKIQALVDQISFDAKTINSVTTYIVDVLPTKTPEFMRSGMTANVTFFVEDKKNILLVPSEALKVQDGNTIVQVQGPRGQPVPKEIQVGISDGRKTEVLGGLKAGDTVLVVDVKLGEGKKGSNPFAPQFGRQRGR